MDIKYQIKEAACRHLVNTISNLHLVEFISTTSSVFLLNAVANHFANGYDCDVQDVAVNAKLWI